MDARDQTTWRAVPVTTVPRTLVDLAAVLSLDDLARACHEAGIHHHAPRARRGGPRPPAERDRRDQAADHPSRRRPRHAQQLEARFLDLLRDAELLLPQTNRPAGGRRVDCRWPAQRLTVELDGYRFHASRHAWEQDRRREREARARGDEFRRYTYGDVFESPRHMLQELRDLIPCAVLERGGRTTPRQDGG